jgi:hypothetical protein
MGSTASSASLQRGAFRLAGLSWLLLAPVAALLLSTALLAADIDYPEDDPEYPGRRSTWELNTSLTFYRYLEPFPRVDTARACRNRCASDRRCAGWTYYDAEFKEAGRYSYRLQRVCVLGSGIKSKQSGNRPGRISGVLRSGTHDGGGD